MPSYRSQFCRMLIKYLVAIKFNPNKTIDEMRRGVESLSKLAGLPSKTNVEKIKLNHITAEWVCAEEARKDRVILYLHGGGYNICSPNTHRELSAYISMASSAKVLLIDYHLAPEHPFPTALEDATLTYRWLLKNGFSGGDIALAGDSATAREAACANWLLVPTTKFSNVYLEFRKGPVSTATSRGS